ncbi:MAG: hypothetical protein JOY71_10300 [Acetobacteraceae bacterium]|nr:hypothetical protein [Acetobacteraceae bacterium]
MRLSGWAALIALGLAAMAPGAGQAQNRTAPNPPPNQKPSASIVINARAAAVGVGYTWGDGILIFRAREHLFGLQGLSVIDLGFAKIEGRGRVYNLHRLQDFNGVYGAAAGQATAGNKGIAGQWLRNAKGVTIIIDEVSQGVRLAAAPEGIRIKLKE